MFKNFVPALFFIDIQLKLFSEEMGILKQTLNNIIQEFPLKKENWKRLAKEEFLLKKKLFGELLRKCLDKLEQGKCC